ncbi:MAG: hypothetical protein KIT09_11195 [Bryobacteraceae bacterium]|nr:hypothetical protein [Bryobacteraceae bacterium]
MKSTAFALGVFLCGNAIQAQTQSVREETVEHRVESRTFTAASPAHAGLMAAQPATFHFIGAGMGMEGQVVKNAPYSADGVTETTRTLGDGTKIRQRSASKVYRDNEGRTRREQTLAAIGEWASASEPPTTVTISDPVAGTVYILDAKEKTARKIKVNVDERVETSGRMPAAGVRAGVFAGGGEPFDVMVAAPPPPPLPSQVTAVRRMGAFPAHAAAGSVMYLGGDESKEEALGERNIEGVLAKGTRVTTTIPVGKMGNDRPITITHESWYSPELQVMVLSESKDPMAGDTTYRLTNIQRTSPPASLFEAPPDYRVEEGGMIHRRIRIKEEGKE